MDYIVYLIYPALLVLLLFGAKFMKRGEWNEEFLSLKQTKAVQGFCAIAIIFHHMALKTCAPYLPTKYIIHGFDLFTDIGYLLVGVFFFASGYGLMKSLKEKENYLEGFFARRILPLIVAFCTTGILYTVVLHFEGTTFLVPPWPFVLGGTPLANTYSWYVLAIILFYVAFYFAFKKCKNERTAFAVVAVVIVLYMLNCDWWMYGDWWYNTLAVSLVGMLLAKNEQNAIAFVKKKYSMCLISGTVLFALSFVLAAFLKNNADNFTSIPYPALRWLTVVCQLLAATMFTATVFILGMKVRIGNKALDFLGGMTLEIYLVHGMFVQGFSFCFFNENMKPWKYVTNMALYAVLVIVLSLASALVFKYADRLATELLIKSRNTLYVIFGKNFKRNILILLGVAVAVTLFFAFKNNNRAKAAAPIYQEYYDEFITPVSVEGRTVACYVVGEGEHTVVLLGDIENPATSMTFKSFADLLGKDNKVVVIDYLGSGFSSEALLPRTYDNMVEEIHQTLHSLALDDSYIFVPHITSSLFVQAYAAKYPEEVDGVVSMEGSVPEMYDTVVRMSGMGFREYQRYQDKYASTNHFYRRVLSLTGYSDFLAQVLKASYFSDGHNEASKDVMHEMFDKKFYSNECVDSIKHESEYYNEAAKYPWSEDLPILYILSSVYEQDVNFNGYKWSELHKMNITNPQIQTIVIENGNSMFPYYRFKDLTAKINDFIEETT